MQFDADGEIRDINGIPLALIEMPATQKGMKLSGEGGNKYQDNSIETNHELSMLSRPASLNT